MKNRIKTDDTLDVFAVRSVGGIFGAIMIAAFGHGTWAAQLGGRAGFGLWTDGASFAQIKLRARVIPICVDHESELNSLDLPQLGERAYDLNSRPFLLALRPKVQP